MESHHQDELGKRTDGENGLSKKGGIVIGNTAVPVQMPRNYYCPLCGKQIRVNFVYFGPIPLQCNHCCKRMEITIKSGYHIAPGSIGSTTGGG